MAMTLEECERMIAAAEENRRKLAIGYMMRFHACHRLLKAMIDAGQLGWLVMGRAQLTCWYPRIEGAWRQDPALGGGGSLADMGSHCIDLLEMFCGRTVEVTALSGRIVQDYPVEDSIVVALRFASVALGFVDAHFNVPDEASVNMLEMYGSKGRVESRGTIGQGSTGHLTAVLQTEAKGYEAEQQREEVGPVIIEPEERVNIYQAEIEDLSDAILHDCEPTVTGADGQWSVRVCQAAYQSAAEGRTVRLGN
jgi:predicted dehydrogenase